MKRTDMETGVVYARITHRNTTVPLSALDPVVLLDLNLWRQTRSYSANVSGYRREIAPKGSRAESGSDWTIGYPAVWLPAPEPAYTLEATNRFPEKITIPETMATLDDFAAGRIMGRLGVVAPRDLLGPWATEVPKLKDRQRAEITQAAADQQERSRQRRRESAHATWLASLGVTGYISPAQRGYGLTLTLPQLDELRAAFAALAGDQ